MMNVRQMLQKTTHDSLQVTVEGNLRVISKESIFLSDGDLTDMNLMIEIKDSTLYDKLLKVVPCLVGGRFLYNDNAVICATLKCNPEMNYMTAVIAVEIVREGQRFSISDGTEAVTV